MHKMLAPWFSAQLGDESPSSSFQARIIGVRRGLSVLAGNGMALCGLVIVLLALMTALCAPLIARGVSPTDQNLAARLVAPNGVHWFGTDELGRDIFVRVLFGARITLIIVLLVGAIVAPIGLLVGSVAGYFGGIIDALLMRVTDMFLAFPSLILALAFSVALGPGIGNAIVAIALTAWPPYARLARAETILLARSDFIAAIRLQGASVVRITLRHIAPLCLSSVVVRLTLDMAGMALMAAGLGFLGLGVQPPAAEWGAMIASGRPLIFDQWWVSTIPGLAIFITSVGFSLLGDGIRDALDPKNS